MKNLYLSLILMLLACGLARGQQVGKFPYLNVLPDADTTQTIARIRIMFRDSYLNPRKHDKINTSRLTWQISDYFDDHGQPTKRIIDKPIGPCRGCMPFDLLDWCLYQSNDSTIVNNTNVYDSRDNLIETGHDPFFGNKKIKFKYDTKNHLIEQNFCNLKTDSTMFAFRNVYNDLGKKVESMVISKFSNRPDSITGSSYFYYNNIGSMYRVLDFGYGPDGTEVTEIMIDSTDEQTQAILKKARQGVFKDTTIEIAQFDKYHRQTKDYMECRSDSGLYLDKATKYAGAGKDNFETICYDGSGYIDKTINNFASPDSTVNITKEFDDTDTLTHKHCVVFYKTVVSY